MKDRYTNVDTIISDSETYNGFKYSDKKVKFVKSRFLGASQEECMDSVYRRLILSVPIGETDKSIRSIGRTLGFVVDGRSCRHEHDCCGCYFGGPATIVRNRAGDKDIVILEEGFSRNV